MSKSKRKRKHHRRMDEPENLLRGVKNPPSPTYNADFYETDFMQWVLKVNRSILNDCDARKDKAICGRDLSKYVASVDREGIGATGSKATRYMVLDRVFQGWDLSGNERVFDVGCGKGRVFAYLLNKGFSGEMYGVEINPKVAKVAQSWTAGYSNINIICGDAFQMDYNGFDVLLLGKPFEKEAFQRFVEYIEETMVHSVKIYYWGDQHNGDLLNRRVGWELQHRDWVFRRWGVHLSSTPMRYSVWVYDPHR